jgi:hypothetical protein
MQFIKLNAVVKRRSRVAHRGDRQPAVSHRRARAAACTEDDHVDESRAIGARVEARNYAAGGWQAAPKCVGHADPCAKRPKCALHGVDRRSARFVVATEQLVGWRGMPTSIRR